MLNVLLVPYVQERLHAGPIEFGWLVSAQGIGGNAGGLVVGQIARVVPARQMIVIGLTSAGGVLLVAAGVPLLPPARSRRSLRSVGRSSGGWWASRHSCSMRRPTPTAAE
jgi:MFS family permease